jgi:cytochrome P450
MIRLIKLIDRTSAAMKVFEIPSHIPADLVRDFDFADMRDGSDVYAHFKSLHDEPDIFFTPRHGGHWVVTRYGDMEAILMDNIAFSSRHQTVPPMPITLTLIEWDGDLHADARKVLAPFFSPKSVSNLEEVARNLTISLIEGFYDHGECDFVKEFALKMPIIIVMSLMGLPDEDTPYLMQISEDIVRSTDPEVQGAAFQRVFDYIANDVMPKRRAAPGSDIFSAILEAKIENGRRFTDEEIISFGAVLIAAGLDTVASTLGFLTKFLAENPAHRQTLVDDPRMINNALEEMMRRFHIANIARVVAQDMEYNGLTFKAGDRILIPTSAAGIDESRYPDPFRVDFERGDKRTLVFGRGPHQCIGSFLARTELRVFLQEWLKRIPDFSIKPGEIPIAVPGKANCLRYLPIVWPV